MTGQLVYLTVAWGNQQRAHIHPDVPFYLDDRFGAHRVTARYEEDHVWIVPVYIEAQEIRVPVTALCAVETCGERIG